MATVEGGCHCGAVRFEAEVDTGSGVECNCSYCAKAAPLLAFTTADRFRQTAGQDRLTDYRFNKMTIAHLFCSACGISAWHKHVDDALAILHTMREPDPVMAAAGDVEIWERMVEAALNVERAVAGD